MSIFFKKKYEIVSYIRAHEDAYLEHVRYIYFCALFFSPELYNSLAGGHEALIFLHHKI